MRRHRHVSLLMQLQCACTNHSRWSQRGNGSPPQLNDGVIVFESRGSVLEWPGCSVTYFCAASQPRSWPKLGPRSSTIWACYSHRQQSVSSLACTSSRCSSHRSQAWVGYGSGNLLHHRRDDVTSRTEIASVPTYASRLSGHWRQQSRTRPSAGEDLRRVGRNRCDCASSARDDRRITPKSRAASRDVRNFPSVPVTSTRT